MGFNRQPDREDIWCCLHCRALLRHDAQGLHCADCGRRYPVIAGIPILVGEPAAYLRSELASLARAAQDAKQRRHMLDATGQQAGLTPVSLARHRDVMDAEISQIDTFLELLKPATETLEHLREGTAEELGARRSGWAIDSLIPYLLRDWTNTSELAGASATIGAALNEAFPHPSDKIIAFAACGAGGLLAELSAGFGRVLGFDLTLPVVSAARHLLDGKTLDIALPRTIKETGLARLQNRNGSSIASHIEVLAMDTYDMAFADGSTDCIVTSFLIDLLPDPRRLVNEIHRVLRDNGVWINYGPSGPLKALWRFDQTECTAFAEAAGFRVVQSQGYRATYLDLSRDCPSWSYQNHVCYLTTARKTTQQPATGVQSIAPTEGELLDSVPQFFPRANLIQRRSFGPDQRQALVLRHERIPGRAESVEIGSDTAKIITLVDGKRTVREICALLEQSEPHLQQQGMLRAFARYFEQGLMMRRHH